MARITVEDCLDTIQNRFELVMVAAKQARRIAKGLVEPTVAVKNDKPTVLALREIAENSVAEETLQQSSASSQPPSDDPPPATS